VFTPDTPLAQMGTFGSIDPYVALALEGVEYRSNTVKGSYTPEWNETFAWDIVDVTRGCSSDLAVSVYDFDPIAMSDTAGSFTVPAPRMSELVRAKVGWQGEDTLTLYNGGKAVVGHDKQLSQVTLRLQIVELPKAFPTLEVDAEARGPRQVVVTVVSANHLPKVCIMHVAHTGKV
jgi:hypothetical protein